MRITSGPGGVTLHREPSDKRICKESTVTHHIRRLLNTRDGGGWTRFYPRKVGLTSCSQGVQNRKKELAYWHERYAVENAAQEFNRTGYVFYEAA